MHCYVTEDTTKEELAFDEITDILDQLHREGCLWICFTGGDPFMREDFADIYAYAKRKGFLITIFTNGTLITPEIADFLREYTPLRIEITLNSIMPSTYERISGVSGSFELCMRGIHLIIERNLPLTLKSIGMSLNSGEILRIKRYVESLGRVNFRYDSIIIPMLDGSKYPCRYRLSPEKIMEIEYSDNDMRQEWERCFQSVHRLTEPDKLFRCGGGINFFNISPFGELQLCHLFREPAVDLCKGTIREGLERLFPQMRSARYQSDSECKDCSMRRLCLQCPGRARLETGNREAPVDYFCQLTRKRAEMKDNAIPG